MRPKVALVLGGGGSRGLAHIGVLDVLTEHGISVDMLVATSMGAIVAVAYALGFAPSQIARRMVEIQGSSILSMNLFSARARQRDLRRKLEHFMKDKTFENLNIPTVLMAVDMLTGKEVILENGDVIPAILASAAVPAVFPPIEWDGMQLADGGVIDSLATHAAFERGAERVIAVDVYPPLNLDSPWVDPLSAIMGFQLPFNPLLSTDWAKIPSMASSLWRATRVMTWHLHEERLKHYPPDILLRPNVGQYGSLDFSDVDGPVQAGREEALAHLDKIRMLTHADLGLD